MASSDGVSDMYQCLGVDFDVTDAKSVTPIGGAPVPEDQRLVWVSIASGVPRPPKEAVAPPLDAPPA